MFPCLSAMFCRKKFYMSDLQIIIIYLFFISVCCWNFNEHQTPIYTIVRLLSLTSQVNMFNYILIDRNLYQLMLHINGML